MELEGNSIKYGGKGNERFLMKGKENPK